MDAADGGEGDEQVSNDFKLNDSGQRQDFSTGSRRDTREGKGRYDLIPALAFKRLAALYEAGAVKYGERNWEKGQPLSRYLDSAMRHLVAVREGKRDEDHAFQAIWNLIGYEWTREQIILGDLPLELDDVSASPLCECPQCSRDPEYRERMAGSPHAWRCRCRSCDPTSGKAGI